MSENYLELAFLKLLEHQQRFFGLNFYIIGWNYLPISCGLEHGAAEMLHHRTPAGLKTLE